MYNIIQIKRRLKSSLNNNIPTLSGGELAYNEKTDELYYGGEFGTLTIAGSGAYVKLDTDQTITGNKTFTGLTTLSSTTFSSNSIIDIGGNVITNAGSPSLGSDVATKDYVDTTATSAITALSAEVYNNFVEKIESEAVTLNGGLTVTSGLSTDTLRTSSNARVGGDLTVVGDLQVMGNVTTLDTTTTVTSAFSINNAGTTTALTVDQTGSTDIAEFRDDGATALIVKNGGNVGIGTNAPNEKLTVSGNISASQDVYARNAAFAGTLSVIQNSTFFANVSGQPGVSTLMSFIVDGGRF